MPYVEGQTIHDADSHIMELPGTIDAYLDPKFRKRFAELGVGPKAIVPGWSPETEALHDDPEYRAGDVENLLLRKNFHGLGAFRREDRVKALDHFGFASQLVFTTTCLVNFGLEQMPGEEALALEAARAHNRMMIDFCSVDRRLLATAYVPLFDRAQAPVIAREALAMGAKALVIPSRHPPGFSPSHIELDALWAVAQEAGVPILFHVGSEQRMDREYLVNGLPIIDDFRTDGEAFSPLTFMAVPLSLWQTLSALVIDGVFDRFPDLRFGAIEAGGSWVPSLMRFLNLAAGFPDQRMKKLSATPAEILARQFRFTPYPNEDVRWIIESTSEHMALFSSDFPHIEGGRDPLKKFSKSLDGLSETAKRRFFRDNFIDLMGNGLDRALHDVVPVRAA